MISKEGLTHHISAQFNAELEEVRSHLLAMGGLVEKQVNDAVTASLTCFSTSPPIARRWLRTSSSSALNCAEM